MRRLVLALLIAGAASGIFASSGELAAQERGAATYQRQRHTQRHYAPHRGYQQRRQAPQVASGTFQRPYPYHLDYYKNKYGGSYEPYFGNLYGPPNVVLAPGYGYGPFGYGALGAQPGPVNPGAVCPHCGQLLPAQPPIAPATGGGF